MSDRKFKTFFKDGNIIKHDYYFPENIIAGDTDSSYIDLSSVFDRDADKEEVIAFADMIGESVNALFPDFMEEVFFVSHRERAEVIETDREVVSDKSYFKGKKMYAMHVVNKEGVEVDDIKIMGLEIKKTDTPKIVQDLLSDIVNRLMDGKDFDEIKGVIDAFKADYNGYHMKSIGRPMNIKTLKKYEEIFEKTGSFKGLTFASKAVILYNSRCGVNDVKIRAGDKIIVAYIKNEDMNDAIAIPVDADELPAFIDEVEIDYDRQWGTVKKKLDTFLIPVGMDLESRKQQLVTSLFSF